MLQREEPAGVVPQVGLRRPREPVVREEGVRDDREPHANGVGDAVRAGAGFATPSRAVVAVVPHGDDPPQVLPSAHVQLSHRRILRGVDSAEVLPEERVRLVQVVHQLPNERGVRSKRHLSPAQVQHVTQRVETQHRALPVQVPELRGPL